MNTLEYVVERSIVIRAGREEVFRYFTDSERFAAWWGAGSRIEPRPGGAVLIRYPNAVTASGKVIELTEPERVVFTYGYDGPGPAIEPGGSRVTVTLTSEPGGTRVHLRHEVPSSAVRDEHVQGWRYQMAVFANVVSRERHAQETAHADRFFAVWNEKDPARRRAELSGIAAESLVFLDGFSCTSGIEDLADHIGAAQFFMPGMEMRRRGDLRSCQGTALCEWSALGPDGAEKAHGSDVFDFGADGRIVRVVGFWNQG